MNADFTGNFSDARDGAYYYDAVGTAKALGIATGKTAASDLSQFADIAAVSSYAKDTTALMAVNGIINGSNGKIDPKALSTRAQAAVVLNRLLTDINK